ncbi:hypothetical protein [Paenibacillus mucilaginosus]|uniref:hypothetical protein n=1 Tax=Paenibacillus mucilaginosus TaxID=61624 RepID=UPI00240D9AD4|nr:hypothetical protein [Paenibacillus mucilaginosus]
MQAPRAADAEPFIESSRGDQPESGQGRRPLFRRDERGIGKMSEVERPAGRWPDQRQRRTGREIHRGARAALAALLLVTGSLGLDPWGDLTGGTAAGGTVSAAPAAALPPMLDKIRVALFIDTGKYVSAASAVTLSAEAGVALSLRGAGGEALQAPGTAKGAVRVQADGYYALLPETGSAADAAAQAALAGGAGSGVRQRGAAYQAYLGPFATKEAAAAAAAKQPGAAVAGPHYASAGSYAGLAEAQAAAAQIAAAASPPTRRCMARATPSSSAARPTRLRLRR